MKQKSSYHSEVITTQVASSGWDTNQLPLTKTELRGLIEADFMRIERTLLYVFFYFVSLMLFFFLQICMFVKLILPGISIKNNARSTLIDSVRQEHQNTDSNE